MISKSGETKFLIRSFKKDSILLTKKDRKLLRQCDGFTILAGESKHNSYTPPSLSLCQVPAIQNQYPKWCGATILKLLGKIILFPYQQICIRGTGFARKYLSKVLDDILLFTMAFLVCLVRGWLLPCKSEFNVNDLPFIHNQFLKYISS